jgi:hypothetical protein
MSEATPWIIGGSVVVGGGLLYIFRDNIFGNKKKPFVPGIYADIVRGQAAEDATDRVAEAQRDIVLPSSLATRFRVLNAKITSITASGIDVELEHIYNAGYTLAVDSRLTKIVRDKEGGHATYWNCFDFERCDIDGVLTYVANTRAHSRSGGGLSDAEVQRHGSRERATLRFPVCTSHCHSDNTYAGNLALKYYDPDIPDAHQAVMQADGKPLKFAYGEEARSGCTKTNSSWHLKSNMCND